jgi:twitching motility protein PilT
MAAPDLLTLLRTAVKLGASDLHITAGTPPAVRLNGRIKLLKAEPLSRKDCERLVKETVTKEQLALFKEDHQLSFSREFDDLGWFRINVYTQMGGFEAAIRTSAAHTYELQDLGVPEIMRELMLREYGLLLVTGPTGNGKTTTFNALIDVVNTTARKKIITIEDPVEYRHPHKRGICVQLELGQDTPDFPTALKHVLRQDPDVIGVGELRDLESIQTALTAAETGHMVLGTIHTPSAPGTITRIMDVFPPYQQNQVRIQLSSALIGVLTQRLLPRADGQGRVLACELLVATDAIRNQIREGKLHMLHQTMQLARGSHGMRTLDQDIRRYLVEGVISAETAKHAVSDPRTLQDLL